MRKTLWTITVGCLLATSPVYSARSGQDMQHDSMKKSDRSDMKHDGMKDSDKMSGDMQKDDMSGKKTKKSKKMKSDKKEMKDADKKKDGDKM